MLSAPRGCERVERRQVARQHFERRGEGSREEAAHAAVVDHKEGHAVVLLRRRLQQASLG